MYEATWRKNYKVTQRPCKTKYTWGSLKNIWTVTLYIKKMKTKTIVWEIYKIENTQSRTTALKD